MKKLLAVIITVVMLIGLCITPSFADSEARAHLGDPINVESYRDWPYSSPGTRDKEIQKTTEGGYNKVLEVDQYIFMCYDLVERYYHYNEQGEMDWLMFTAYSYMGADWMINEIVGEYLLSDCMQATPFVYCVGIYDIEEDNFYTIRAATLHEKYMRNINDALGACTFFTLIGDVDGDGKITIKDATKIQKYAAHVLEYPKTDKINRGDLSIWGTNIKVYSKYISDMNHDGERNVNDATAVQKNLVKLPYRVETTGRFYPAYAE